MRESYETIWKYGEKRKEFGGGVGKYPSWAENVVAPIKVPKVRNL